MNTKKIESLYKSKIKILEKYNKDYYQKSKPSITDFEYDILKKEIISLEIKYEFLKSKKSPSITTGYKPSKNFNKVAHRAPMLSLANAFLEADLLNFEKKVINFISEKSDFKITYMQNLK